MRYLLCLMAVLACEAARLPRTAEHPHFPNFQSVYHGHGATSYQNVQIDSHGSIPLLKHPPVHYEQNLELESEHLGHDAAIIPIVEDHVDHLAIPEKISYEDIAVNDIDLNHDVVPEYYEHYPQEHYSNEHEFEYHL